MPESQQPTTRHRINVSISVKGIVTWDCTVEVADGTLDTTLAESDRLVAALKLRYPAQEG